MTDSPSKSLRSALEECISEFKDYMYDDGANRSTKEQLDEYLSKYTKALAAQEQGVEQRFLVIVCSADGQNDHYAIFSTEEKASTWAAAQEPSCVISPYIIDEPEYGNKRNS